MYVSAQIKLTDLMPVKHNGAKVSVGSKRFKLGYFGTVTVSEFSRELAKEIKYVITTDKSYGYLTDVDATAAAITLRRELIEQNKITSPIAKPEKV